MRTPIPDNFKSLNIDRYDSSIDPEDHLTAFTTQIFLTTDMDVVMCNVFTTTLKGATLAWYSEIPAQSTDSFETSAERFSGQFATSRAHRKTLVSLVNLRQERNESLRDFMVRFTKETSQIRGLMPGVALLAILSGLKPGPFMDSLPRRHAASMEELRRRAIGYINQEEMSEFNKWRQADQGRPRESKDRFKPGVKKHEFKPRVPLSYNRRPPRYETYTPLNTTR